MTAVGRPAATSCAKVGPDSTARLAPGAASCATSPISRPVPASIPLAQSTRSRGAVGQAGEHRRKELRGDDRQQHRHIGQIGQIAGRADRRVPGWRWAGTGCCVWAALISATSSGSRAQSSTVAAVAGQRLRQRRAPGARADNADCCGHAFTPAPRTGSASRIQRPARARRQSRADRSGPAAAARSRPRRSSPRYRCTAPAAARRSAGRCAAASASSAARTAALAATPPATTSAVTSPAHRQRAAGAVDHAVDRGLLERGGDIGICDAFASLLARAAPRS